MNFEHYVIEFFKEAGVEATKIPESDEKTPDFQLVDEVCILVEVKEKTDSAETISKREKTLRTSDVYENIQDTGYRNRLSGIIKHAAQQLRSQKNQTNSEFCFLFLIMNGVGLPPFYGPT